MGTYDRKGFRVLVQHASGLPDAGLSGEQSVLIDHALQSFA
jgi:hypothetical protein